MKKDKLTTFFVLQSMRSSRQMTGWRYISSVRDAKRQADQKFVLPWCEKTRWPRPPFFHYVRRHVDHDFVLSWCEQTWCYISSFRNGEKQVDHLFRLSITKTETKHTTVLPWWRESLTYQLTSTRETSIQQFSASIVREIEEGLTLFTIFHHVSEVHNKRVMARVPLWETASWHRKRLG